jgi:Carboxypeptidase regulatory-like domain/TonB dependent receptor-like, beta-barrel/TonB-dependent Receptor Plug Domain
VTSRIGLCLLWCALASATTAAQVPTGTISGRVTDQDGAVVPGASVTATSPNLQGSRTVVTSPNGDYSIPLLPPGDYRITFELPGFQSQTRSLSLGATESVPLDVTLAVAPVSETVTVVGQARTFVETAQVATNVRQELMATLPSSRTLQAAVLLAPNVTATGPGGTTGGDGSLTIAGAMSFESLFLLNGVAITENLRGQPFNLFIEDAIQETTVATAGISAEYGRFNGGVVNAITKSGGNDFSGSLRFSFNNDNWRSTTPFNETKLDKTVPTYEYTAGGPVLRDRVWFFTAGRLRVDEQARQTFVTNITYPRTDDEKRYEGKVTYSLSSSHSVRGSYTKIQQLIKNVNFQNVMDTRSLYNQGQPQDLLSLNYNGLLGSRLSLEGQYSRRQLTFTGAGSPFKDLTNGTLLIDRARGGGGTAFRYWSPTFCGVCDDEKRDNTELLAKGSYLWSTSRYGAHSLVFGYDTYNDHRFANNHQSGSDFRILGTTAVVRGETLYPVFLGNNSTIIQWNPITLSSQGTDLRTHSVFANDAWRFSSALSFNLGLRWDRNQGEDAAGNPVSNSSNFSPRLGVVWDPGRDGRWAVSGSFGRYVSALNSSIAENSPAGNSAEYTWFYQGPDVNPDPNAATLLTPDVGIQRLFDWFNANGGTNRPFLTADVPGVNTLLRDSLKSPNAVEYAAGVSRTIAQRGTVRVDWVFRDFKDFYIQRTDLTTGRVTNSLGTVFDVNLVENSDELTRRYQGGTVQATYRVGSAVDVGGTYTLSRTWGNFDGENPGSGPLTGRLFSYPEYRAAIWNQPDGNLGSDQRHRARVWGTYHVPITSGAGTVDLSLLYSTASGIPYSSGGATASAPGTGIGQIDPRPYVANPGYASPLGTTSTVEYFFFPRDRYRTETQHRTDLSVNYQRDIVAGAQVFVHAEVLNLFDQFQLCGCGGTVFNNGGGSDIRTINTSVLTASTSTALQPFNPFTQTPVQGVNWNLGPTFGQPVSRFAYTSPRTFRFNVGVRF